MFLRRLCLSAALLCAGAAHARAVEESVPAATELGPICTDRPTKANVVCTVPQGSFQIESDVINWTRTVVPNGTTDLLAYSNPTIKYGLGPKTDFQVNIAPYVTARSRSGQIVDTIDGVGDLYLRMKQNISPSGSDVQIALIPFVKAPTARAGIGNGRWEGGIIAPTIFALPGDFALNFGPELDVLADSDRNGYHAQVVGLANISKSFGPVTLYAELWTAQNFDPAGTVRQLSADFAVTYLIDQVWQLDAGSNFGLNRATPDVQVYLGVSNRF